MITIRGYSETDRDGVLALWSACDLTRPWNDPVGDIERCVRTPSSAILVGVDGGNAVRATVMTGSDGHRGWIYYLAVAADLRRSGLGRRLVEHAETWLAERGVGKCMLMIRPENTGVRDFYEKAGYEVEERVLMARWFARDDV